MEQEPQSATAKTGGNPIDFKPKFFLRCHSKQRKDVADVQTQVRVFV